MATTHDPYARAEIIRRALSAKEQTARAHRKFLEQLNDKLRQALDSRYSDNIFQVVEADDGFTITGRDEVIAHVRVDPNTSPDRTQSVHFPDQHFQFTRTFKGFSWDAAAGHNTFGLDQVMEWVASDAGQWLADTMPMGEGFMAHVDDDNG